MTYYGIEVRADGSYGVYKTSDGIRLTPIPTATFDKPRKAIDYCAMREANVSPLRVSEGAATDLPQSPAAPSEPLTRLEQ